MGIDKKLNTCISYIRSRASGLVVALSGGVDSAALLWVAGRALGPERVLAATGRSPAVPEQDLGDAAAVARKVGCRHRVVETRELDRPAYVENRGDRCFHCRTELFEILGALAREEGFGAVAYGAIVDDLGDDRPGMQAARDAGVLAPLLESGMGKDDVREIAALAGLPVRDKPAAACLSSRLPAGTPVTAERLGQVERAEAAIRALGFGRVRVRHHGDVARLELEPDAIDRALDGDVRARLAEAIRSAGFRFATLDLEGYRTGGGVGGARLYRIDPQRDSGQ